MSTLLCINRRSRSGDSECGSFVEKLQKLGPVLVYEMSDSKPLTEVVESHRGQIERMVVGGGDGTLNRALPAILDAGVPLGVLPLGTANDFARSMGLPSDPDEALDAVLAGHTEKVSVGEVNGHPFLNAVGIGLGPELTRRMDHEKKQRLGVLAYLTSLVEAFGNRRRRRAEIVVDGVCHRMKFMQITIANGIHYGGGLTICEDARMNDGVLNILCIEPQSAWELFRKFMTLRWGAMRRGQEKMELFRGGEVEVSTLRPAEVTADGELLTETPLHCRSRRNALKVYAPADRD